MFPELIFCGGKQSGNTGNTHISFKLVIQNRHFLNLVHYVQIFAHIQIAAHQTTTSITTSKHGKHLIAFHICLWETSSFIGDKQSAAAV